MHKSKPSSKKAEEETTPVLARFRRASEFIDFSESLRNLIRKEDLVEMIRFDEILELTYTLTRDENEETVIIPYLITHNPNSKKNAIRDRSHKPKKLNSKIKHDFRRLSKAYRPSPALPEGYAWHIKYIDLTILKLFKKIKKKNKDVSLATLHKVVAKIIEAIIKHEVHILNLPFNDEDQPVDITYLRKFRLKDSFIKQRIQRLKSK